MTRTETRPGPLNVGLLGGSFDPPHRGHLAVAVAARDALGLDRVLLIPAPAPPHKETLAAAYEDRLAMVRALVAGQPGLEASDVEANLPPPHYTVRTLESLVTGTLAGAHCYMLIGADSLCDLHTWRDVPRLFELATVVAVSRPGHVMANPLVDAKLMDQVVRIEDVAIPAASRDLRRTLREGRAAPELTPPVADYIRDRHLYQ